MFTIIHFASITRVIITLYMISFTIQYHMRSCLLSVADSEGGGRKGRSPPPLKSAKKKRKSVLISPFPHIWWLKMQHFLGSRRSPALFNIILNIALLKNLENNTCSYILSSFYMVATGEGNFDMKMQDFWTLKSLNCRSAPPPPAPPTRAPPWT